MDRSEKYSEKRSVRPVPEGFTTVTPFIVAGQADRLIDFIKKAFHGKVTFVSRDNQNKVMHATVQIGNSIVMIADAMESNPAATCMLYLYVENIDSVYQNAVDADGKSIREPLTEFYGDRSAAVRDTFGNVWWIATRVEDVSEDEMKRRAEKFLQKKRQTADVD
jgi:uncharacterized glyoxalase superfamily protein PhnB